LKKSTQYYLFSLLKIWGKKILLIYVNHFSPNNSILAILIQPNCLDPRVLADKQTKPLAPRQALPT
jgi:hypothetical protein